MRTPDGLAWAIAGAYAFTAAVFAAFLPRLGRLARREPRTRRAVLAWRVLCGAYLLAAAAELVVAAPWAPMAVCAVWLVVAAVMLWPYRHAVSAVLRGVPPPVDPSELRDSEEDVGPPGL
jgi:hypothetical protein